MRHNARGTFIALVPLYGRRPPTTKGVGGMRLGKTGSARRRRSAAKSTRSNTTRRTTTTTIETCLEHRV